MRFGLATLNHSPLHGLPCDWEAHLDAAAEAEYDALAPDIFWLRALEADGISLAKLAEGMRERQLACMEIAGLAIGSVSQTAQELEENLRYAQALDAEFVNTRIVGPMDAALLDRLKQAVIAFRERGARGPGTRVALEFSYGSKLNGLAEGLALVDQVDEPGVGVTLDTWHFFTHPMGPDWSTLSECEIGKVANLQFSDGVPYAAGEFSQATMNRRLIPGSGQFDFERLATLLSQRGFEGAVVVEVLNAEERERPIHVFASECLRSTRRCLGK